MVEQPLQVKVQEVDDKIEHFGNHQRWILKSWMHKESKRVATCSKIREVGWQKAPSG